MFLFSFLAVLYLPAWRISYVGYSLTSVGVNSKQQSRRREIFHTAVPATNEPRTGDVEAACSGQIGMAETRDNGYVNDKLLKKT